MMIHRLSLKSYVNNIKISLLMWFWGAWKWNPGIWPIRRCGNMPTPKISLAYSGPDGIGDNYWKENHSKTNDHVFLLKGRSFEKDDDSGCIMEKLLPPAPEEYLALISQVPNRFQNVWVIARIQLRKITESDPLNRAAHHLRGCSWIIVMRMLMAIYGLQESMGKVR